jgi:peptidoglycan/LPS O-acetylase OafA/YrhL
MDRIRGFDGLRALAFLAVFLQHETALGYAYETGGYGVWLFFVLSGFLIVRILAAERRRIEAGGQAPRAAMAGFFWRRTLRIAPAYAVVMAVATAAAVLGLFAIPLSALPWFWAPLADLYYAFVARHWTGELAHLWSVAVEEQFYLIAAPLFLLAPGRAGRAICGATLVAAAACDLTLRSGGADSVLLYTNPLTNFGAIALGGLLALSLPRRAGAGAASAPGLAALCAAVGLIVGFQHLGAYPADVARLISAVPFWAGSALAGLLIVSVYLNQESRLVRALEWAPVAYVGRISYGLYLWHNLLPHRPLAGLGLPAPDAAEAVAAFALAAIVASLSWRLIERPALALKHRPVPLMFPRAAIRASEWKRLLARSPLPRG